MPEKFQRAIDRIRGLEKHERYIGAFVFGSVARGEITENSDLDVVVITSEDNPSMDVLHPVIEGVKLDLSFCSHKQAVQNLEEHRKLGRIPMILESLIIFDKTGQIAVLKNQFKTIARPRPPKEIHAHIQFIISFLNEKVERFAMTDPCSSLLSMHMGLNELMKMHYELNGRWWVSSKRLLTDLECWDTEGAQLLKTFVSEGAILTKKEAWSELVAHVLKSFGGTLEVPRGNALSEVSKQGLRDVLDGQN